MSKLIYILTNKSFNRNDWVKIGFTTNLQQRIDSLSNTSLPYDYEPYATYEVPDSVEMADKTLHKLIAKLNPKLRLVPNKEFFAIAPEDAFEVLEAMAKIHGRENFLIRYSDSSMKSNTKSGKQIVKEYNEEYFLNKMNSNTKDLYFLAKNKILAAYPDLKMKFTKLYIAFLKNGKDVVDITPRNKSLDIYFNVRHSAINDPKQICENVSNIGHWANGDWRISNFKRENIEYILELIKQPYNNK